MHIFICILFMVFTRYCIYLYAEHIYVGRQHPSERALHGLLKGRAGMPPKARAKGVAAKAKAKAAAAALTWQGAGTGEGLGAGQRSCVKGHAPASRAAACDH